MENMLNDEQCKAYDLLRSGANVFLTGKAGTGKSFLLDYFISESTKSGKSVLVCAPTGIAAQNVNGATLHRAFKLDLAAKLRIPTSDEVEPIVKCADIIIIDEISMCRIDLFEFVMLLIKLAEKQTNKQKQIIVVGDFFQLPPVVPTWELPELRAYYHGDIGSGYAFQSHLWQEMNFKYVELRKVMRQSDEGFVEALDRIRFGDGSGGRWIKAHSRREPDPHAYNLVATKDEADRINEKELNRLDPRTEKVYEMEVHGDVREDDMRAPKSLKLRVGAKVMILVNDTGGTRFVNGSYGWVVETRDNSVVVSVNNRMIEFKPYKWESLGYKLKIKKPSVYYESLGEFKFEQYVVGWHTQIPIKLASATTVHKAQGATYDSVNLNLFNTWENGQVYTALSRIRDVSKLYVHGIIDPNSIHTSSDVLEFYSNPEEYKTKVIGPFY